MVPPQAKGLALCPTRNLCRYLFSLLPSLSSRPEHIYTLLFRCFRLREKGSAYEKLLIRSLEHGVIMKGDGDVELLGASRIKGQHSRDIRLLDRIKVLAKQMRPR